MPIERPELHDLLERIRHGDQDAARDLLFHFEPHVRRVVRRRLPMMMRSKFDSMDFVQSVWGDFFARLGRREIDFDSPGQLAKFLAMAAQSKVSNEFRKRLGTKKFDLQKEVAMGLAVQYIPGKGRDATPSQNAVAHERLQNILGERPELHKKVLRLRSQGFTFVEIAKKLGIDERSARRILHAVEKELGLNDASE